MFERPPLLSDPIRGPYHNDQEARAAQNGALPPDLTLIASARNVERNPSWWVHPFLMLGDIIKSYQEGGADYVYALLTGFSDPPADFKMAEGMYYNDGLSRTSDQHAAAARRRRRDLSGWHPADARQLRA